MFDLTVVIAEAPGQPELEPVLGSVVRSCSGLSVEILVIGDRSTTWDPPPPGVEIRRVPSDEGTLVPVRWGQGISAARAPVIACLSTEFSVASSWAGTLLELLDQQNVIGVAAAVALAPDASSATTAMYLLRFSPFLPQPGQSPIDTANIPGDGAIYRRDQILRYGNLLAEGFWEIEFHRRWLAEGSRLRFDPSPLVVYHGPTKFLEGLKLRYHHGSAYGTTMVLHHRNRPMRHVLAAPVLPVILASRVIRRAVHVRGGIARVVRALLPLLALTSAWSLGEAVGAARAGRPAS